LLRELELKGNSDGLAYLDKDDTKRAVIFFEIAAQTNPHGFQAFYNLACVYASKLGEKKKALKNLKIAVENLQNTGYKDFTFLNKEKDLDPVRNEKEFLEMLRKLGMQSGDSK
jgi:tetratricopeptide (TPR) repeat protein